MIKFDENKNFTGIRNGEAYEIRDNKEILEFFDSINNDTAKVEKVLSNMDFWGCDLTEICGATEFVKKVCNTINTDGIKAAMEHLK